MIPKIIHQIWIGPNPIPEHIKAHPDSIKREFDDYEYILWTEENLPDLPQKCIDQVNRYGRRKKYAFQSDIIRYFLLNKYGGIYMDIDFYCKKRFDHLITKPFFCVNPHSKGFHVANGIFGCQKDNPILSSILNNLKNEVYHGPLFFSKYIQSYLGIPYKTHILNHLKNNPSEYIECFPAPLFFNKKTGYCHHDAMGSWLPRNKNKIVN